MLQSSRGAATPPGRRDAGRKDSACKRSALSSVGWSSDRPERVQVGDKAHPTLKEDTNGVPGRRSHTAAGHRSGNGFRVEPGKRRVAADNQTAGTSLSGLRLRRRCRTPAQTLPDVRRWRVATHPSRVGVCRCRVRTLMSSAPTARLVEIRGGLISAPARPSVDPEETICWEQIAPREIRADRDGGLVPARRPHRGAGDAARVPRRDPEPGPMELKLRGGNACVRTGI